MGKQASHKVGKRCFGKESRRGGVVEISVIRVIVVILVCDLPYGT